MGEASLAVCCQFCLLFFNARVSPELSGFFMSVSSVLLLLLLLPLLLPLLLLVLLLVVMLLQLLLLLLLLLLLPS